MHEPTWAKQHATQPWDPFIPLHELPYDTEDDMRHFPMIALAALTVSVACSSKKDENVVTKSDAGTVASPTDSAANANGVSLVRVVNAAPGSGSLTIRAGDESPFSDVAYKKVTPYQEVRGNMVRFRVVAGNDTTDLASNNEAMSDGNRYTIFIMPNEDANSTGDHRLSMKVVRDEMDPDSSKAQLRFVNAAPKAGELDLAIGGQTDPVFDNVNFGNEAGYKGINPISKSQLQVRREDGKASLASVRNISSLQAGKLYTVVVTGKKGAYDVISFEDAVHDMSPVKK